LCLWHFVLQCGIILSILMLLLSSFLSRLACHFLLKAAIMARRRNFEFLGKFTAVVIYRTTKFKLLPKPVCQFVITLILNMWSSVSCRHISEFLIWKFVKEFRCLWCDWCQHSFIFFPLLIAFHTFGPPGKTVVELCIIGFLMGTCIAFFVVVGDLGPGIVAKTLNINNTSSLREMVLIGMLLLQYSSYFCWHGSVSLSTTLLLTVIALISNPVPIKNNKYFIEFLFFM